MKPDQTHDPRPSPVFSDATEPGRPGATESAERLDEAPAPPAAVAHEAVASPLDVERMILSLERSPRPPAPTPDERPSSDGGRFVAYGATGRPAQAHTEQEVQRQALAEVSVLVNATPVPTTSALREAATAPTSPQARGKLRASGRDARRERGHGGVRGWAVWAGAAAVLALGAAGLMVALSGYDEPLASVASVAPAPSALVTPAGPASPKVVLAMPAPESVEEASPPSSPSAPPTLASSAVSAPPVTPVTPASSLADGAGRPVPGAAPAVDGPVEPPRPKKPPFDHW